MMITDPWIQGLYPAAAWMVYVIEAVGLGATVRDAIPAVAASELPVCCVEDDRVVGLIDRETVLTAIAGEHGEP